MKGILKYKEVFYIFIVWLLVVSVFSLIALNRFNLTSDTAYSWIPTENYYQTQGLNFDTTHAQWDSFWLLDIVRNGYYLRGEGAIANVVFFPLYPLLVKTVTCIIEDDILAGWLVSVASLLLAMIFLSKLVKEFYPKIKNLEVLVFLLIFPTAYFFNTVYTESLFLFLSIATIYYAKKERILPVIVFGVLAALTRVTGILLFIPLSWYVLERENFKVKQIFIWSNSYIFAIPFGVFLFFAYHYFVFGDWLLFFRIESLWGRSFEINTAHFIANTPVAITNLILDGSLVVFALAATVLVWRRIDRGLSLYMLATIAVAISTGTLMSIGRYILVLFPIYMLAASIKNRYIEIAWLLLSCMLFTLYTILFVNHYWAG